MIGEPEDWYVCVCVCVCVCACVRVCVRVHIVIVTYFAFVFEQFLDPWFIELLIFHCKMYWMFYVSNKPEGKFLCTETIQFYCIVLYCVRGMLQGFQSNKALAKTEEVWPNGGIIWSCCTLVEYTSDFKMCERVTGWLTSWLPALHSLVVSCVSTLRLLESFMIMNWQFINLPGLLRQLGIRVIWACQEAKQFWNWLSEFPLWAVSV